MRVLLLRSLLALSLLLATLHGAEAKKDKSLSAADRFAANNTLFVIYHEIAHLLVDQLGLPVLGREEDAADNMATWILLNKHTAAGDQTLADAAYGWLLSGIRKGTALQDSDFYDVHSLDKQRAFEIVCMMVGADPDKFGQVANAYRIDRTRQDSCRYDHEKIDRSLKSVLAPYSAPRAATQSEITYNEVSGTLKIAADAFRASGVFEDVAKELQTHYALPHAVSFEAKRCGEPNAYYDADTVGIIFCYELMQDFIELYTDDLKQPAIPSAVGGLGRSGPGTPEHR